MNDWEEVRKEEGKNQIETPSKRPAIIAEEFFGEHTLPTTVLTGHLETIDNDTVKTRSLIPDKNAGRDLGSPTRRYRNIYLTNLPALPTTVPNTPTNGMQYLDATNSRLYIYSNGWKYVALTT